MAIPGWIWSENSAWDKCSSYNDTSNDALEIEHVTNAFRLLSNETRLEILLALYRNPKSITYTELRESTSVDDKGRFNYHLRQVEQFVQNQGGNYTLSRHGENFIQNALMEGQFPMNE